MSDYLEDVKRYDSGADADVVAKIVKHLGIAYGEDWVVHGSGSLPFNLGHLCIVVCKCQKLENQVHRQAHQDDQGHPENQSF